jgi:hypothetical protein
MLMRTGEAVIPDEEVCIGGLLHTDRVLRTVGVVTIDGAVSKSLFKAHQQDTLIKKKTKFSSYRRQFIWDRLQSHTYMRKGFLIYEEMRKIFPINEEAVNHI